MAKARKVRAAEVLIIGDGMAAGKAAAGPTAAAA